MLTQIGTALVGVFFIYMLFKSKDNIKTLFQRSQEAPQHWGTFAFLMTILVIFVYFLIKL